MFLSWRELREGRRSKNGLAESHVVKSMGRDYAFRNDAIHLQDGEAKSALDRFRSLASEEWSVWMNLMLRTELPILSTNC